MNAHKRNDSIREVMLAYYGDKLREATGFDYPAAEKIYTELGNSPGVYPDTCLLFYNMIAHYQITSVLEVGSGFSTLFLGNLSSKLKSPRFSFLSLEQVPFYANLTMRLLAAAAVKGMPSAAHVLGFPMRPSYSDLVEQTRGADIVFIDGLERPYFLNDISAALVTPRFVIIDDSQAIEKEVLYNFMVGTGRHNFMTYNGTGRSDRIQFISLKHPEDAVKISELMGYL